MPSIINAATSGGLISTADTSGELQLQTASTTALTIGSSQKVGIGNSIPGSFNAFANNLVIGTGAGSAGMTIYSGSANGSNISFADGTTGNQPYEGYISYSHSDNSLGFWVNYTGSSAARLFIDSSGNTFVGKTSDSDAAQGLSLYPSGSISYNDNNSGNRTPVSFRRSGTQVGSIRTTAANTSYYTASSDTNGAVLVNAGIAFPPTQVASADANTLDDYEEGTFTPTIVGGITGVTYTSQEGFYTKVGRFVSYTLRVSISAGTAAGSIVQITGLPFASNANGNNQYFSGGLFTYAGPSIAGSLTTNLPTVYTPFNSTAIQLYRTDGDSLLGTQLNSASTFNGYFIGSYFTS
jgi:hypothetical protein